MGVGRPEDIVEAVRARHRHVRLRDADAQRAQRAHSSRAPARCASAMRSTNAIRARSTRPAPATPAAAVSAAPTCAIWTAAARCSGRMLATIHNLHYYQDLMAGLREAIAAGTPGGFRRDFHALRLGRGQARRSDLRSGAAATWRTRAQRSQLIRSCKGCGVGGGRGLGAGRTRRRAAWHNPRPFFDQPAPLRRRA